MQKTPVSLVRTKQLRLNLTESGLSLNHDNTGVDVRFVMLNCFHIHALFVTQDDDEVMSITDEVREDLLQRSTIYHSANLSNFQKRVNDAAAEIALKEPKLVRKGNRGALLAKARQLVSEEGYMFKKGKSRSKVYGAVASESESPPKKHVKLSEEIRTQRIGELREDIEGVDRHLSIKEKRLKHAESLHNYSVCDQFLEQIRELKASRREKCRELVQLEAKEKRAKRYKALRSTSNAGQSSSPITDCSSSLALTPSGPSRTPTPTPASPLGASPLFIPKHTDKGCTSYAEPVDGSESGSTVSSQPF